MILDASLHSSFCPVVTLYSAAIMDASSRRCRRLRVDSTSGPGAHYSPGRLRKGTEQWLFLTSTSVKPCDTNPDTTGLQELRRDNEFNH